MIGILAFGSLRADPGCELEAVVTDRLPSTTPFPVEYARYSSTRGGAPTLVPVESGRTVKAEILILAGDLGIEETTDMLWRRETRQEGSKMRYQRPVKPGRNSVLVEELSGFAGLPTVLYTDFPLEGKIAHPVAAHLARKAIESVRLAGMGRDGIAYLIDAKGAGILTRLTSQYEAEILRFTGTSTLSQAREHARSKLGAR